MPDEHFNILGLDPKPSQHRRGHGAAFQRLLAESQGLINVCGAC